MDPSDPAYPGQAHYTPRFLAVYDRFVLGFMARVVWRCPTPPLVECYRQHVGRNHLDIGPGTGYFLAESGLSDATEVTLVDPNPDVLAYTARRLASMSVTTIEADVRKPLPIEKEFDSAALNLVLHCLPGPQQRKAAAIRNIAAKLTSDGVLFGATVLGTAEPNSWAARASLWALNRQGAFDNLDDTAAGLREILEESFEEVDIDRTGSIARFTATKPRSRSASGGNGTPT